MSTQSFNIESLLDFNPPRCLCQNCLAIWTQKPRVVNESAVCATCGVHYVPSGKYSHWDVIEYLINRGFGVAFDDFIAHSKALALIARNLRMDSEGIIVYPPLRALMQAILNAKSFIHFTSFGVSPIILGALKLAAQQVAVRGIVSVVSGQTATELTDFKDEAPLLETRLFEYQAQPQGADSSPHQKIIVIDGLIAFKGSANLTVSGWRRAAEGRDMIECVTDVKQVVQLHNRYFSPIWDEFSDVRIIRMMDENPNPF
jgi:hypothetical protein